MRRERRGAGGSSGPRAAAHTAAGAGRRDRRGVEPAERRAIEIKCAAVAAGTGAGPRGAALRSVRRWLRGCDGCLCYSLGLSGRPPRGCAPAATRGPVPSARVRKRYAAARLRSGGRGWPSAFAAGARAGRSGRRDFVCVGRVSGSRRPSIVVACWRERNIWRTDP